MRPSPVRARCGACTTPLRTARWRLLAGRITLLLAFLPACGFGWVDSASAQGSSDASLLKDLNAADAGLPADKLSGARVFGAWLKAPKPPTLDATAIWPGMAGWSEVSAWAGQARDLGDALAAVPSTTRLGLPYGTAGASAEFQEGGITVDVGTGDRIGDVSFDYLKAVQGIGAYAAAEMYRAAEAGEWERAAAVGIGWVQLLRQVADRQMLEEVRFGLSGMVQALSIHRDFLWRYRDRAPVAVLKDLAIREYPRLAAGNGERLSRLALPEGDVILANAVFERTFRGGVADPDAFVTVYGADASAGAPLMRFGNVKTWRKIAELHGAKDATAAKVEEMYADWYRRWRSRPYGALATEQRTVRSATNEVKYAAVFVAIGDLQELFDLRRLVSASLDGTAIAAGLCGYRQEFAKAWPKTLKQSFPRYAPKRMDFDPYQKAEEPHRQALQYERLASPRNVLLPGGSVTCEGVILYAIGKDGLDDGGRKHADDASSGDLILWPPIRELLREAGK